MRAVDGGPLHQSGGHVHRRWLLREEPLQLIHDYHHPGLHHDHHAVDHDHHPADDDHHDVVHHDVDHDHDSADDDHDDDDHDHDDAVLVLTAADGRAEARFVLADRLVLAHLAADVRGLLAEGQSLPPIPDAEPPTSLPTLRVDVEAGFACTGFSIRGLPAIGLQVSRNDPPLAFLVLDADQLAELLGRARELLGTST